VADHIIKNFIATHTYKESKFSLRSGP